MFNRNSDYALNKKDPDAIVCKSATGIHICLTRADFSSAEGLTIKEIAAQEKVKHQNISKRILAAQKILKKFLERWVQNGTKNGGK